MRYLWMVVVFPTMAWASPVMVCDHLDGHLSITSLSKDTTPDAGWQRTLEANPSLQGVPCAETDSSQLPQDRAKRYAWRMRQGKVQVDDTIPDPTPPDPVDIPVESLGGVLGGALAGAGVAFLRGRKRTATP